jgi:tetratricopeptide (TPR) repeat protein
MTKRLPTFFSNNYFPLEIVCLVLAIVAVYSGTLDHSFHFDDKDNIWNNSFIQISNLSLNELQKAGFEGVNRHRPVANISFALNYYFHGLDVRGFHLVNIFIHLLTGIIFFYFIKTTLSLPLFKDKYKKSKFIPFFAALIWLVHPLHTQSVTYIVQRMNSMAALFFIMAMLFYVKARLSPKKVKRILFFLISFISGLLAFGAKQNTITLPIFILLYEWYFFQNLRLKISRKSIFWIAAICLVLVAVLYFYVGTFSLSKIISGYGGRPFSLVERLMTQPRVILHYITLLVFPAPSRLNLDYDFPLSYSMVTPPMTLIAIILIIGMLGLALYFIKNNRLYSFCILWFLGNLVIESSIIPLEMVYEHRTYLPSMLAILMLVLFFEQIVKQRKTIIASLIVLTLILSFWTYERNKIWQDKLTLRVDVQKKSPNKARVNHHLGQELSNENRIDDAIPFLIKAINLYEQETKLKQHVDRHKMSLYLAELGIAYKKKGEYQKAIIYLNKAIKEFPYDASINYDLGICYLRTWRLQEAVYYFSQALKFAQHHNTELSIQQMVEEMRMSLEQTKKLLNAQKRREILLKQSDKK